MRLFFACGSAVLLAACARPPVAPVGRSAPVLGAAAPAAARAPAAPRPDSPAEEGPFLDLEVPGFGPSVVSLPRPAAEPRRPRAVVVVAHGAGDRPEWQCQVWRDLTAAGAYVLCLRGRALGVRDGSMGFYYPDHRALADEAAASLAALKQRFGDAVDVVAPVYVGFSQGAVMGSLLLPTHPAQFAAALLIEGGFSDFGEWTLETARRFHDAGGRRVVFACGRALCATRARSAASLLRRAAVDARVLHVKGAGHTYAGAMTAPLREAFEWLIHSDPRWR